MTYSNDYVLSFYLNGKKIDSVQMDCEILQLSSDNIFVGIANDIKTNKDVFYGLVSSIEIYDIALTDIEVKEISENPTKIKLRNFGNFKSSEFLYSQVTPQLSTFDSVVDLGGEYKVEMNNIKLKTFKQSFKTFLPKPHRRDGKFKSLKHAKNSSIENRWVHSETRKNQIRFYNEVRNQFVDFRIDGLNTLRYNEISKEENGLVTKFKIEL
jgi:DNA mismatch repair ATPase MutS